MLAPFSTWLTASIFAATYTALAIGQIPRLRIDRAGIAFVGSVLMLCTGLLTLAQATAGDSIDYETLFLLFGMMVVVGFLRISGFFARVTRWMLGRVSSPALLLAAVICLSGILSAFLVNDIVCLALTPLVLHLTRRLRFDPIPQLIGLATAANIGSAGTITGNPQNMFIGAHSHISYSRFALHLMPVALFGLLIDFVLLSIFFRRSLRGGGDNTTAIAAVAPEINDSPDRPLHRYLQWKSGLVALVAVLLFFTGLPIALVAIGAAAVLLLGRIKAQRVYREIDWNLLLMFVGLFIVVHAFQLHVVSRWDIQHWHLLLSRPVDLLSIASAILSNLVSNVPAVLLFEPVVPRCLPARSRPHGLLWQ